MARSKHGSHKEDKTLFGAYITPEMKTIVIMTADRLGITMTDILMNGIRTEATRAGVLVNGEVPENLKTSYNALLEMVKLANAERKRG